MKHYTLQWYSRWNMSYYMLSEEKRTKTDQSVIISSRDITIWLLSMISNCENLVSASFKYVYNLQIKVDYVTI